MLILVFLVDSTAAEMAVNGGATTMSQKLASATSGANAAKNARVSAMVLYIFQLPAITRRLIELSSCPCVLFISQKGLQRPGACARREIPARLRHRWKYAKSCPPPRTGVPRPPSPLPQQWRSRRYPLHR